MILRVALLAAILVSLAFSPAATYTNPDPPVAPVAVVDRLASTSSFYTFRRDMRRCASPRFGECTVLDQRRQLGSREDGLVQPQPVAM